jgi:hypothetical protein
MKAARGNSGGLLPWSLRPLRWIIRPLPHGSYSLGEAAARSITLLQWAAEEMGVRKQSTVIDPKISPEALAIASGSIISALLDMLVTKEILSIPEIREVLHDAMTGVGHRLPQSKEGFDASQLIAAMLRHFSERGA